MDWWDKSVLRYRRFWRPPTRIHESKYSFISLIEVIRSKRHFQRLM